MKRRILIKSLVVMLIISLSVSITSCSKTKNNNEQKLENEASNFTPVEFVYSDATGDYNVKVEKPRKRAVTLSQFMTEMLLALDLGDSMIGTALLDNPILDEYKETYDKIPVLEISGGHDISKESFLSIGPDFVSGWDMSINEQTTGSPNELIEKDIIPFLAKSYSNNSTIDDVYEDFELLGKIFGVEDKAKEVVEKMKSNIEKVTTKVGSVKSEDRVKMMVYDSGEDKAMVVGSGLANNLIELAGGNNIFGEEKQPYANVSWESVVARNPEVIVVTDYMAGTKVEEKIDFLKSHPALKDVDAVKNNKIYVVGLADLSPGVRNSKVVETMHGYFYGENR